MSRRRWAYTSGGQPLPEPIEVSPDFQAYAERVPLATDRFMDGDMAPDGTDIGSRQKRRDWMRATGSADASDFTQHWQRAARERRRIAPGLKQAIISAHEKLRR